MSQSGDNKKRGGKSTQGSPGRGRSTDGKSTRSTGRKTGQTTRGAKFQSGSEGLPQRRSGSWKSGSEEAEKSSPDSKSTPSPSKPGPGKRVASHRGKVVSKKGPTPGKPSKDGLTRLNKFIAAAGICSRREADKLISAGLITINGENITELGTKVKPGDDVRYNGNRIQGEKIVYLLLNKPKDYVTTTDDPKERKTVMTLIKDACKERVYPVGRLDRQTTGVLMFTNDGDIAKRLTHPGYNKKKIYHVFLDKAVSAGDLKKLAEGVTLEDGFIQPDAISYASTEHKKEVGLEIHSGRNRIVRRMFEHLDYRVAKLDRVYFAGLTKKDLPRGKWRFLTEREVNSLKMNSYE